MNCGLCFAGFCVDCVLCVCCSQAAGSVQRPHCLLHVQHGESLTLKGQRVAAIVLDLSRCVCVCVSEGAFFIVTHKLTHEKHKASETTDWKNT